MLAARFALISSLAILLTIPPIVLGASEPAVQIVFSGQSPPADAFGTFDSTATPYGFWIWCQDENPADQYLGACAGSIYFYALGLIRGVSGTVVENADDTYTMSVSSDDGAIDCDLTNLDATPSRGPTNDIFISCSTPSGSDTALGVVVQVTGE